MKLVIIAVRDTVSDMFQLPQYMASVGAAKRAFADEINRPDEKNQFYKHPSDFELFHLGNFDDHQADFEIFDKPLSLGTASSFVVDKQG